jgi:uncharacterized protein (TIGR03382 family)
METTIFDPVDVYCERLGPGLWAEPVNAATNLAFIFVAALLATRMERPCPPLCLALVVILAAIGVGSGLFHTFANPVTALLDVGAIAAFVLLYVYAVNRHVLGWSRTNALLGLAALVPYFAVTGAIFAMLTGFAISAGYWPVALLIAFYALGLRRRRPEFARGLAIGAGILCVSISARSLDMILCDALPLGTHFLWHLLNAAMLGWMIEVYRREAAAERLAAAPPQG